MQPRITITPRKHTKEARLAADKIERFLIEAYRQLSAEPHQLNPSESIWPTAAIEKP